MPFNIDSFPYFGLYHSNKSFAYIIGIIMPHSAEIRINALYVMNKLVVCGGIIIKSIYCILRTCNGSIANIYPILLYYSTSKGNTFPIVLEFEFIGMQPDMKIKA